MSIVSTSSMSRPRRPSFPATNRNIKSDMVYPCRFFVTSNASMSGRMPAFLRGFLRRSSPDAPFASVRCRIRSSHPLCNPPQTCRFDNSIGNILRSCRHPDAFHSPPASSAACRSFDKMQSHLFPSVNPPSFHRGRPSQAPSFPLRHSLTRQSSVQACRTETPHKARRTACHAPKRSDECCTRRSPSIQRNVRPSPVSPCKARRDAFDSHRNIRRTP